MNKVRSVQHIFLLLLFSISGAAALIYEVVWTKYLILIFGSTVQAQTIVLSTFMLGLALGNYGSGRWTLRSGRALLFYSWVEVIIGIYALSFTGIYSFADSCFVRLGSQMVANGKTLWLLKACLSAGVLLVPTILMGATLPLMLASAKAMSRKASSINFASSFYAANCIGAVMGAWISGFILIHTVGLSLTLWIAGMTNIAIGLLASLIYIGNRNSVLNSPEGTNQQPKAPPSIASKGYSAEAIVCLTGAVSMGLEILASRCLSLIFGASTLSFSIVLIAFILGIGIAGILVSSRFLSKKSPESISWVSLILTSLILLVGIGQIERWTEWYRYALAGIASSSIGYFYYLSFNTILAIVTIGIPAVTLGMILPAWMNHFSNQKKEGEAAVGRLLSFNTAGSVMGVLLTGLWLMPRFGLRSTFAILAACVSFAACLLFLKLRHRWAAFFTLLFTGLICFEGMQINEDWRYVLSAGIFRMRDSRSIETDMQQRKENFKLLFYEDGTDATVSVETGRNQEISDDVSLRVNGKADATSKGDLSTQYLLAHLPLIANPGAKNIFVLGFGSGITAGALLGHPIEEVTVCENCAPVLRAGYFFSHWNRGVLSNPKVKIFQEDARTILKLRKQKYDIVISEPSNPWMAGVGSVFSREFYELCASRMNPGGVMAQWFHVYEMNNDIVAMVIRTFHSVFPSMEVWDSQGGDIILLGSEHPWKSDPDIYRSAFSFSEVRADLQRIGISSPEALWARQLSSQTSSGLIAGPGRIQTDEIPVLEYEAPRAFFIGKTATLLEHYDERTWLLRMAGERKRQTLQHLPTEVLKPIFREFNSVNSDIRKQLVLRFQGSPALVRETEKIPCIFTIITPTSTLEDKK